MDTFAHSLRRFRIPAFLLIFFSLAGAFFAAHAAPRSYFTPEDEEIIYDKWPEAQELPSGIRYVILKEGDGPLVKMFQRVSVLYKGTLLDGTVFSEAQDPAEPFVFTVGTGQVILGWEKTFPEMKVGEKRVIILPYALAYGLRGKPPQIPNRATLVFEIEILSAG
jgi:FKBP-type peptidyl-prolyl cis-trans isomerase